MMATIELRLTKGQAHWVAWALDPMPDFMADQREDGTDPEVPQSDGVLPILTGPVLAFSVLNRWVGEDLLYRLASQAMDMADTPAEVRTSRVAVAAAEMISDLYAAHGIALKWPN